MVASASSARKAGTESALAFLCSWRLTCRGIDYLSSSFLTFLQSQNTCWPSIESLTSFPALMRAGAMAFMDNLEYYITMMPPWDQEASIVYNGQGQNL
jgi:hypothetical protein